MSSLSTRTYSAEGNGKRYLSPIQGENLIHGMATIWLPVLTRTADSKDKPRGLSPPLGDQASARGSYSKDSDSSRK